MQTTPRPGLLHAHDLNETQDTRRVLATVRARRALGCVSEDVEEVNIAEASIGASYETKNGNIKLAENLREQCQYAYVEKLRTAGFSGTLARSAPI